MLVFPIISCSRQPLLQSAIQNELTGKQTIKLCGWSTLFKPFHVFQVLVICCVLAMGSSMVSADRHRVGFKKNCKLNRDCKKGLACDVRTEPISYTCLVSFGGMCTRDGDCANNLSCLSGRCACDVSWPEQMLETSPLVNVEFRFLGLHVLWWRQERLLQTADVWRDLRRGQAMQWTLDLLQARTQEPLLAGHWGVVCSRQRLRQQPAL